MDQAVVFGLHHPVVQAEHTAAKHDLRLALQGRIDLLTDGLVEGVRGRFTSGAVRGEDLHLVDTAPGDFAFIKAAYHIGGLFLRVRLNKGEIPAEVELRAPFIDVLGVMGNRTVLCLTEDLIQYCDRDKAAVDQLVEHISRPNTLQLVRVAHKEQFRAGLDLLKQLPRQPHIHHGGFIDDDQIGDQGFFLLLPVIVSVKSQQTVQSLCIHDAGSLRHTPAGLACGSGQLDDFFRVDRPVRFDHRFENRTLAGAGATGDDGQIVAENHLHTLALFLRQADPQPALDALHDRSKVYRLRDLQSHLQSLAGGFILLSVDVGEVNVTLIGYHHVLQDHALQCVFNLLVTEHLLQLGDLLVEQLHGIFDQLLGSEV